MGFGYYCSIDQKVSTVFVFFVELYERNFNVVAVASSSPTTPATPPKPSIGRRRRPKSCNTASQNSTVVLKLKFVCLFVCCVVVTVSSSVTVWWYGGSRIHSLPYDAANALVQHLVHARVQDFLLEEQDRTIVRQHPGASARGSLRIRRGAEDGTRDAFNGRHRHAYSERPGLPVDNIGV